jgi:hypothetical protein
LIPVNAFPTSSNSITVNTNVVDGSSNNIIDKVYVLDGIAEKANGTIIPIPYINSTGANLIALYISNGSIQLRSTSDYADYSGYIRIKYTKTTDAVNSFTPDMITYASEGSGEGSGTPGQDGVTFIPHLINVTGGYQLSWTNDGNALNPDPVTILNGQDGQDGTPGTNGTNGQSVYDIWLEAGNTGTKADFIDSLQVNYASDNSRALEDLKQAFYLLMREAYDRFVINDLNTENKTMNEAIDDAVAAAIAELNGLTESEGE